MTLSHIIAALHLITLGIGYGFLWMRAHATSDVQSKGDLKHVFFADAMYGIAAVLWITTGLWRAFGGLEKGNEYYLNSTAFWVKMTLFMMVFFLELYPMATLIKWRRDAKKDIDIDLSPANKISMLSYLELALITCMVFVAVLMARGMWY